MYGGGICLLSEKWQQGINFISSWHQPRPSASLQVCSFCRFCWFQEQDWYSFHNSPPQAESINVKRGWRCGGQGEWREGGVSGYVFKTYFCVTLSIGCPLTLLCYNKCHQLLWQQDVAWCSVMLVTTQLRWASFTHLCRFMCTMLTMLSLVGGYSVGDVCMRGHWQEAQTHTEGEPVLMRYCRLTPGMHQRHETYVWDT